MGETYLEFGPGFETGHLTFEFLRMPQVVGIQKSYERARCAAYPQIARRRDAGVSLFEIVHFIVVTGDHVSRSIGGAVIDDDDFQWTIGLCQDTIQSFT